MCHSAIRARIRMNPIWNRQIQAYRYLTVEQGSGGAWHHTQIPGSESGEQINKTMGRGIWSKGQGPKPAPYIKESSFFSFVITGIYLHTFTSTWIPEAREREEHTSCCEQDIQGFISRPNKSWWNLEILGIVGKRIYIHAHEQHDEKFANQPYRTPRLI